MNCARLPALLFGFFFLLLPCVMAQSNEMATVRVVAIPGRPLPIVAAQEQGFFARRGITVSLNVMPHSAALRNAIAEGTADVAHAAVDNGVAIADAGVVIVMGGDESFNELIAQPGTKSVKDLRGQVLIVDAPDTAYALQLKKMLLMHGLHAGSDYQLKPMGTTPHRLEVMRSDKSYAASMLSPPTSLLAKRDHFVSLGSTREVLGPYQALGAFVRQKWAKQNSGVLVRYLAGYIEGQRWLLDPAHKQQVIELIIAEWKVPQDIAVETYSLMTGGWFQPDAKFDPAAFETVLKLRAEIDGDRGGHLPSAGKYYDPEFYNLATSEVKR
jgi:ABC-type nitrate/sulfonate/bicarbonate transport system substrate-binding protein